MRQWTGEGQMAAPLSGRTGGRQRRQPDCYQYCADAPCGIGDLLEWGSRF